MSSSITAGIPRLPLLHNVIRDFTPDQTETHFLRSSVSELGFIYPAARAGGAFRR